MVTCLGKGITSQLNKMEPQRNLQEAWHFKWYPKSKSKSEENQTRELLDLDWKVIFNCKKVALGWQFISTESPWKGKEIKAIKCQILNESIRKETPSKELIRNVKENSTLKKMVVTLTNYRNFNWDNLFLVLGKILPRKIVTFLAWNLSKLVNFKAMYRNSMKRGILPQVGMQHFPYIGQ